MARRSRERGRQYLAAAADAEAQARRALLAGGLRGRRILLEALQMRRDDLVIGRHRSRAGARADGGSRRRLPFGPGRRGGARRRRGLGRLLGFLANRLRLVRHRYRLRRIRDDLGRLGLRRRRVRLLFGRRHDFGRQLRRGRLELLRHRLRPGLLDRRRGVGLLHLGPRRDIHRRRLGRRRRRRHVHHDGRDRHPRRRPLRVPGHAERDQRRVRGNDQGRRCAPAQGPVRVGCIVQNESVHVSQFLAVSFGRRGRPARS